MLELHRRSAILCALSKPTFTSGCGNTLNNDYLIAFALLFAAAGISGLVILRGNSLLPARSAGFAGALDGCRYPHHLDQCDAKAAVQSCVDQGDAV